MMTTNPSTNTLPVELLYPSEIQQLPMFYPHLTRLEAEQLLCQHNQGEGTFLIRPNALSDPSFVSISVYGIDKQIHKVRAFIEKDSKDSFLFYINLSNKFRSFQKLLKHYHHNQICVKQQLKGTLFLLHPLNDLHRQENQGKVLSTGKEELDRVSGLTGFRKVGRSSFLLSSEMLSMQVKSIDIESPTTAIKPSTHNAIQPSPLSQQSDDAAAIPRPGNMFRSKSVYHDIKLSNGSCKANRRTQRNAISRAKDLNPCRPPAPLPQSPTADCDPAFFYSEAPTTRDYFPEIYQRLKEADVCECGLRLVDSGLSDGWEIHRSSEKVTEGWVFFQKEEITTWDMPQELLPLLTKNQIEFILYLCHAGPCPIPPSLVKWMKGNKSNNFQKEARRSSYDSSPYVSPSSLAPKMNSNDEECLPLRDNITSTTTMSSINSTLLNNKSRSQSCPSYESWIYESPNSIFNDTKPLDTSSPDLVRIETSSGIDGMPLKLNTSSSLDRDPLSQLVCIPESQTALHLRQCLQQEAYVHVLTEQQQQQQMDQQKRTIPQHMKEQQQMILIKHEQQMLKHNQPAQITYVANDCPTPTMPDPMNKCQTPQRIDHQTMQQRPRVITKSSNVRYVNLNPEESQNI